MATQPKIYAHITKYRGVCGGQAAIDDTRVRVKNVVLLAKLGRTPDEILTLYPPLSLAQVYTALTYYYDHREEIEADLAADDQMGELSERSRAESLEHRPAR